MAREVFSVIGSGTVPQTYGILPPDARGTEDGAQGVRGGSQVVIANPEDMVAVEAFAVSGVVVGTTPVQIFGPTINNLLPRTRMVIVENVGANALLIGPTEATATVADGFEVPAPAAGTIPRLELPLMHNNSIWARSDTGTTTVKLLMY